MDKLLLKINTAALVAIAASLTVIAYRQIQPEHTQTDKETYLDTHSGKFFHKQGEQLIPIDQPTEERLRKEVPDGRSY